MTASGYFEYYLIMLGWVVNNGIWELLASTGLVLIPIIAIFVTSFIKAREQSWELNVQSVIKGAETKLWIAYVVIMFACLPLFPVKVGQLQFNQGDNCGVSQIAHDQTQWGGELETIGNMQPKVPLWWGLVHGFTKGITYSAIATLPCTADIRGTTYELQDQRITDPALVVETGEFIYQCYAAARQKLFKDKNVTESWTDLSGMVAKHESNWIGSKIFLETDGYYNSIQAKTPQKHFPYDSSRDEGYARGADGGGYPYCDEWWAGLRGRLAAQIEPTLIEKVKGAFKWGEEATDVMIRNLVSPESMTRQQNMDSMFSSIAGDTHGGARGALEYLRDMYSNYKLSDKVGWSGDERGKAEGINKALRHSLPLFQAIMYFVLVVALPVILVYSIYSLRAVILATMGMFSIHFLTFWWEVSRWMDAKLLGALYNNQGAASHVVRYIPFTDNSTAYWMTDMVLWISMIVMPLTFMAFMAWAGYSSTGNIGGAGADGRQAFGASAGAAGAALASKTGQATAAAGRVASRGAQAAARRIARR